MTSIDINSSSKDESVLLLFMVLSRCLVEQFFLRDAVSLFSFPSGANRTDKAGVAAAATVRGFWLSQISTQEEKQLQNSTRKDFGMKVVTCPAWQGSDIGHVG